MIGSFVLTFEESFGIGIVVPFNIDTRTKDGTLDILHSAQNRAN